MVEFSRGCGGRYQVAWYHIRDMQHEVSEHELEGGAKLLAVDTPGAISFYFSSHVRNGYRFCDPASYDLPHLLEHLSFEGNQRHPEPLEFKSAVERLGAGYNASTGANQTRYYFVAGSDHQKSITDIALDQVLAPIIDPTRVDQQKAVITQELTRHLDNDGRARGYRNHHTLFPTINPPWEDRIKRLATITVDDVRAYWESTHISTNLRFVAAGDFEAGGVERLKAQINHRLTKHTNTGKTLRYTPLVPGDYKQTVTAFPSHIPTQNHFHLTLMRPGWDEESEPALAMIGCIFNGGMASRMSMKARERGLTYSFSGGYGSDFDSTELWMADQTSPEKLPELIELGVRELKSIARADITEDEFERAQGLIVGSIQRSYQVPAGIAGWYNYRFLYDLPSQTIDEWIAEIRAVDREAIRRAGTKFVASDNWALTLIGKDLDAEVGQYKKLMTAALS